MASGALNDIGVYPLRVGTLFLGDDLTVAGAAAVYDSRHGVDVAGSVLLRGPAGATAQLSYGFQHAYRSMYALWGDAGRIEVQRAFTPPAHWQPVLRIERPGSVEERILPADDQFRGVVRAFRHAVDDPGRRAAEGRAIVRQAALLEAARQASHPAVKPSACG